MSMSRRECPHPKCVRVIHESCFACRPHWFALPLTLRLKIKDAFTAWTAKRLTLDALRAIQDEGVAWFRANPDAVAAGGPQRTPRHRKFLKSTPKPEAVTS